MPGFNALTCLTFVVIAAGCGATDAVRRAESLRDTSFREPAAAPQRPAWLAGEAEIPLGELAAEVIRANPRLTAMRAAGRAMAAMVPQVSAIPDPEVEYMVAPIAIPMGNVHAVAFRHRFPWPGTLDLRGEESLLEAQAMEGDLEAMRPMLASDAAMAFYEAGAAARMEGVLREHLVLPRRAKP